MKSVNIGICGLGTVGGGTVRVLQRNLADINARAGCDVRITQIGARSNREAFDLSDFNVTHDIFDVAKNPEVDIVVELIGGTTVAKELVEAALSHGKHVVTANKALIAEFGNELFDLAHSQGVNIYYEAAVAGGIPIIRALREGLVANKIEWLAGIINGTGNFILTEMSDKGRPFDEVLKEAQTLGYAEADPTFDVEGIDAAHKLVILASLAFGMPLQYNKAYTEGIAKISTVDVHYAAELGYRIKHLGIARRHDQGIELRVHPTLIPHKRLIANVDGVLNAVVVKGDAVGPTLYYGPGAGAEPTASAVVSDIVDLCRGLVCEASQAVRIAPLNYTKDTLVSHPILPIDEVETAFYLRVLVDDKPGVMSKITQILSDQGISIEALIQKQPAEQGQEVPVIVLSNTVKEKYMNQAITAIEALDAVNGEVVKIRMEPLD